MANNVKIGLNVGIAKQTIPFVDAGITSVNTTIINKVDGTAPSYKPGRTINAISGFEIDKGYLLNMLTAMDLTAYITAPGDTSGNTTPAAPTIIADDSANTIDATHSLGDSEIMISINDAAYIQFNGTPIAVGDVVRPAGYYKFKTKAATGRNESPVASSPAFTSGTIVMSNFNGVSNADPVAENGAFTANSFFKVDGSGHLINTRTPLSDGAALTWAGQNNCKTEIILFALPTAPDDSFLRVQHRIVANNEIAYYISRNISGATLNFKIYSTIAGTESLLFTSPDLTGVLNAGDTVIFETTATDAKIYKEGGTVYSAAHGLGVQTSPNSKIVVTGDWIIDRLYDHT